MIICHPERFSQNINTGWIGLLHQPGCTLRGLPEARIIGRNLSLLLLAGLFFFHLQTNRHVVLEKQLLPHERKC
jgi:hypothetical protein